MDIDKRINIIKYTKYRYEFKNKKMNSSDTVDFFDEELCNYLIEHINDFNNSQKNLLKYFDFSLIFKNISTRLNSKQEKLLTFLIVKDVDGIKELLSNIEEETEKVFFSNLYKKIKINDSRPFWFSFICKNLQDSTLSSFINNFIDEESDMELLILIKELYNNNEDNNLINLLSNSRILELFINRINPPFFYEIVDNLKLDKNIVDKRTNNLKNILLNYYNYDIETIKDAYADLYLHDLKENCIYDIETILNLADDDEIFKTNYLKDIYLELKNIITFLKTDDMLYIEKFLSNIPIIDDKVLSKCYTLTQKRFKYSLEKEINKNKLEDASKTYFKSSFGNNIISYNINNENDNQKNFTLLVSTIPCTTSAPVFFNNYYSNMNGERKYNRRSFSLINENKLTSLFGGENRIIFGYRDINNRDITSATLGDGRTDGNEYRFRKKRKVDKSSYLSINKFISETQSGHNEITISSDKTKSIIEPSYILVLGENKSPTQLEIDLADLFSIPIKNIDISKYKQTKDKPYNSNNYNYISFIKEEPYNINIKRKFD